MITIRITAQANAVPSESHYYAAADLADAGHSVTLLLPDRRAWAELQRDYPPVASRVGFMLHSDALPPVPGGTLAS